ncbi:general secretion pathway protein GspB [Corallincola platygyrae]|uniref:General secretion pathway protein GspB n=1 Tax=Corallincola platygyrae TaxID=1193278 RepID=A0ABW4XSW2_9GAMM
MSYILQALKRSENEQKTPETPGINTEQHSEMMFIEEPPQRPVWLPILAGAAIVSLAILGGMWWMLQQVAPSTSEPSTKVEVVQPVVQPQAELVEPALIEDVGGSDLKVVGKREVSKAAKPAAWPPAEYQPEPKVVRVKPAAKPSTAPEEPLPEAPAPAVDLTTEAKPPVSPTDDPEVSDDVAQELLLARFEAAIAATQHMHTDGLDPLMPLNVPPLTEYPQSWQDAVPSLSFSQHIYSSDANKRWVKVNGKTLYEGDRIEGGLVLERIEPQAVIMSLQGEYFSLPALSDW